MKLSIFTLFIATITTVVSASSHLRGPEGLPLYQQQQQKQQHHRMLQGSSNGASDMMGNDNYDIGNPDKENGNPDNGNDNGNHDNNLDMG
jgi:hypothetical protein